MSDSRISMIDGRDNTGQEQREKNGLERIRSHKQGKRYKPSLSGLANAARYETDITPHTLSDHRKERLRLQHTAAAGIAVVEEHRACRIQKKETHV
jgi:hypothetical protein